MTAIPWQLAMAALVVAWAMAQDVPKPGDLARKAFNARLSASIRARGRITVIDDAGKSKVFQIAVLQKKLSESTNLLWQVTGPLESRLRVLVEIYPAGGAVIRAAFGDKPAAVLPPRRWTEPILGSLLTYEDLVDDALTWPKQTAGGMEGVNGRLCDIVKSEPDARHPSSYSSVSNWIDRASMLPIRILKKPVAGGPAKEIVCSGLKQQGGHWGATSIVMKLVGGAASTRLAFTAGSENAKVQDAELDPKLFK